MSRYYRFRTAERLLGRAATEHSEARPGELDDLTIYFASPAELNDPLEGHRDTCFLGDEIAWKNLIKHYALSLLALTINVYAANNEDWELDISLRPENFPPKSRDILNTLLKSVLSCDPISEYATALANRGKAASRYELSVHIGTLHSAILSFVFEALETEFYISETIPYREARENFLNYISLRAKEISTQSQDTETYREIKDKLNQQALRGNAMRDTALPSGAIRVMASFPDEFCQQLDHIMYPHWYVACFMRDCTDSSIWGSYGDNHKGICLIYKAAPDKDRDGLTLKKLPFSFVQAANRGRPKSEYHLNMPLHLPLIEIKYSSKYLKPNFFDSIFSTTKEDRHSYWHTSESGELSRNAASTMDQPEQWQSHAEDYLQSCTTKTAHWAAENESRIIIAGNHLNRDERLVQYYFHELEGVIFGIKTPDSIKVEIIKKIAHHCKKNRRSDFKFYQARFNETYSKIEHDHLKYIRFNTDGTLNSDPRID